MESQEQASHTFHRPWKSRKPGVIPTFPQLRRLLIYKRIRSKTLTSGPKPRGWAKLNCRSGPNQIGLNPSAGTNRGEHTRRSIISSFLKSCHTLESLRLAKRSRALVETNPARNSQLETHQDDDPGSRLRAASSSLIHRIERSPHALENSKPQCRLGLRVSLSARTVLVFHSPTRNGVVCHCNSLR